MLISPLKKVFVEEGFCKKGQKAISTKKRMAAHKTNLKVNPYLNVDLKNKSALAIQFAPLVKKIACRIALRLPPDIEISDLIQVGMMGLLDAVDRYNPQQEANFKTFAEFRIRGAMLDELRARDWIPRSVKTNAYRLEKAFLALRKRGILHPDHADLAKEMEMTVEGFEEFLVKNVSIPLLSVHDLGMERRNEGADFLDNIPGLNQTSVEDHLIQQELLTKLQEALKLLPQRDYQVLALSFHDEMNLKEIAQILDLTEARICQIRTKSIAFLRSFLSAEE